MVKDPIWNNHALQLPTGMLKEAEFNEAKLYFLNKYSQGSVGLSTFKSPDDNEQYLKTLFEADFCHYIFPCFD